MRRGRSRTYDEGVAAIGITLALLLVAVSAVPVRLWGSRLLGSLRPRRRPRRVVAMAPAHLAPTLCRLVRAGRHAIAAIEELLPLGAEYRRTLPYVSLFFVERSAAPHVRRDRWVVRTREDFESGVGEVARRLRAWQRSVDGLAREEHEHVDAAGPEAQVVRALLEDGTRLPRSWAEARRFRFSGDPEAAQLLVDLERVAAALRDLETALLVPRRSPYRGVALRG